MAEEYLNDRSPVSVILGPVGSGKTVASLMKGVTVSMQQQAYRGVRSSRGIVLRNTYPELVSTVIKSFQEWFPAGVAPIKWDAPITARMIQPLADGTRMDLEIFFMSFDRPDDVKKLKSLEATWVLFSEMSELPKAALDMGTQRAGRFPPARWGGATWYGAFGDTNYPDDDHYLYRLGEQEKPKGYKFFKQPGGLIYRDGEYFPNPAAENIPNLPGGYEYYFRQLPGKTKEWIKVFVLAQYGTISDGRPVYPEWADDVHCRPVPVNRDLPLLLGFDYGLTPACVICQISPRGQLLVIDELFAKDMGIRQFARDVVRPHLAVNYAGLSFQAVGDPAGNAGKDTEEKTCFMELAEEEIPCCPATSNNFVARREAVAKYLTRMSDGKPCLIVDPKCDMIRRGFNGRYQYKRLQVVGSERFKDVPDKNDYSHCFVGKTLIATPEGGKWIEDIEVGDFVSTPMGPKRVSAVMSHETSELAHVKGMGVDLLCTPDHPFITPKGIVRADELQYNDVLIGINTKEELEWVAQQSTGSKNSTAESITASQAATTKPTIGLRSALGICTEMFGSFTTALSLMALRFTIGITTKAITTSAIWSWSVVLRTLLFMAESVQPITRMPPESTWSGSGRLLLNGIDQRLVWNGIPSTGKRHGWTVTCTSTSACNAARNTKPWWERARRAFARQLAKLRTVENLAWTTSAEFARSVAGLSWSTSTPRLAPARRCAGVRLCRWPRGLVRVYDLTVDDAHCFFANGVLVHNCHDALQYAALYSVSMNNSSEWSEKIDYPQVGIV